MDKQAMKELVCKRIDEHAEKIIKVVQAVEHAPELGYKETKTAAAVTEFLTELGYDCRTGLAITGVKTALKKKAEGLNVAILGELDAVICHDSPTADPVTGAAHSCGHHIQLGVMLGTALGLKLAGIDDELAGNVTFMAVPAEEYVELEYRQKLCADGKITYIGGKQELVKLGEFDDVDMAMMIHCDANNAEAAVALPISSNGFVGMTVQYVGKEAHAAAAPDKGINALNAAMIGLMGVHAMRETFRDEDVVRVHPIITKGGDLVNSVPADVRLETYIRAKTTKAMDDTCEKVMRAFKAGGDAIGAQTNIHTIPGYLPLVCCPQMNELFLANSSDFIPAEKIKSGIHFGASTDMGDITHIMPGIHPFTGGMVGVHHTREFHAADYVAACIVPAKAMAMTVIDLLADGAEQGQAIKQQFKPVMTKDEYLALLDKYFK